jgi:hypothetical protein
MSSALAIAAVSALLRNLLDNGVMDDELVSTVGAVRVTALAPDLITLGSDAGNQLNVFLYQVMSNVGWRNVGLPTRDARGDRISNPPLALDLRYLLTAYSARELHSEILLGRAMQILHEVPALSRDAIRRGLGVPDLLTSPSLLPPDLRAIAAAELEEQIEAIKITPHGLGMEEASKLWAALQSKYRPSTAYDVSVVLIESTRPTRRALPVRLRKIYVAPQRAPRIDRVLSQETATDPAAAGDPILAGHTLVLEGRHLKGERTRVHIGATVVDPPPARIRDDAIFVELPEEIPAGLQTAQIVQERRSTDSLVSRTSAVSNVVSFLLRPSIVQAQMVPADTLQLDIEPPLLPQQRAMVFLNERVTPESPPAPEIVSPRAYSFVVPVRSVLSPPQPITQLQVPLIDVEPGSYLVRIQVDGAESPLFTDIHGRYDRPSVVVA